MTFKYDVFGNRVEEDDYNASTQVTTVTKFAYEAVGNIWVDLNSSNQLVDRRLHVDPPFWRGLLTVPRRSTVGLPAVWRPSVHAGGKS